MFDCYAPKPEKPEQGYSNTQYYGGGFGQNGKGEVDRSHESTKKWSEEQMAKTGLTDKEPL